MGGAATSRRCRGLGLAGSLLLAAGGLLAGAVPARHGVPVRGLGHLHRLEAVGLILAYAGVTVLVVAWSRLGAALRESGDWSGSSRGAEPGRPVPPSVRGLYLTLAVWGAPLLLLPPLFSRDAYSYLAQGAMTVSRIDAYRSGPAALGGPLLANIPAVWQHTPTPYGPVFLTIAAVVAAVTSSHILLGVLGMRLLAVLGLVVMVATLPRLAAAGGVHPASAVWLAGLNPLVLLHLVAGAHNDALMLAFLITGLAAAVRRRPVLGAVLVTLGALVKAPAALGLLAVAALWSGTVGGPRPLSRALAGTGGIAAATTFAVGSATGLGYGWLGALGTPASPGSWSVTEVLGRVSRLLLRPWAGGLAAEAAPAWRWAGMAAAVALCAVLWWYRYRLGVVPALGLMLTAVVVLGPSIRPWYLLWGLVPIAVSGPHGRAGRWLRLCSAALAFSVPPSGFAPTGSRLALAALGAVAAVIGLWVAARVRGGVLALPAGRAAPGPEPEYSA